MNHQRMDVWKIQFKIIDFSCELKKSISEDVNSTNKSKFMGKKFLKVTKLGGSRCGAKKIS